MHFGVEIMNQTIRIKDEFGRKPIRTKANSDESQFGRKPIRTESQIRTKEQFGPKFEIGPKIFR